MENLPNSIINLFNNTGDSNNYTLTFFAFILCIITSFILRHIYIERSNSLSPKNQLSIIIPILSLITFLVILIVKSSLALSLGLVGALSVIRFRTPVKEPEDLTYLFLAIGIGIGYGALQIVMTTGIFIGIILIIYFFLSKKDFSSDTDFNLVLEFNNQDDYFSKYEKIIEIFKQDQLIVTLTKMEKNSNNNFSVFLKINFANFDKIQSLSKKLNDNFSNVKYSLYESKILF